MNIHMTNFCPQNFDAICAICFDWGMCNCEKCDRFENNKQEKPAIMNNEQKELLLKICELYSQQFFLNMVDTWSSLDGERDAQYARDIRKSEEEYRDKYGELPVWKTIEDVWETKEGIVH